MNNSGNTLNVLIACEESQAETEAFRNLGHNAFSCDIQPCRRRGHPEWHIHADVTPLLQGEQEFTTQDGRHHAIRQWDLIVAHPPCTYLCKVGAQHLYKNATLKVKIKGEETLVNEKRWNNMLQARKFFFQCLYSNAPYVAVENPIPMRVARLPRPSCFADPSWYGHKYTKKTLYWLKNLPPLVAKTIYPNAKEFVRASRGKYRSRTFPGLARAIAEQWSAYILNDISLRRKMNSE